MVQKRIGVVYLTDGRRDDLTYASAVALGLNHRREIDIHIVQSGFHAAVPPVVLKVLQAKGHRMAIHALKPIDRGYSAHGHITSTTTEKAEAIAAVSDDHELLCYIDNDTLAMRALDLAAAMPKTQPLAAVPDLSISTGWDDPAFFQNCDKHGLERRYFNAGFMAINVPRWKDSGITERYNSLIKTHADFCPYRDGPCTHQDQCVFNISANRAWETLPLEFNVQKAAFQTKYWDKALIRHYTGPGKFLPAKPYRLDRKERRVLSRVSCACQELALEVPSAYLGLPYWANGLRRKANRTKISRLIDQFFIA